MKISWRRHLRSSPDEVYRAIASDAGRARFWAESTVERDGRIEFRFPDGTLLSGRIIDAVQASRFTVEYFGGSIVTFVLEDDEAGGTDLLLTDDGVREEWHTETLAGWVSVLLALKAAVDFDVDLRNHDPQRTWDQSYVDN